jgi:uncharacterized protein YjbI with pentapeptide repeats
MKYKFLTLACLIITSVLTSESSFAQNQINAQDLYSLCAKFPLNSLCKGIGVPTTLKERDGTEALCKFTFDPEVLEQSLRCKLLTNGNTLTIYQEHGERIDLLEDKRSTSETEIKSDLIFISNHQVWNEIHRWEIGFVPKNESKKTTSTNFLVIFLIDKDTTDSLTKKISLFSSDNPKLLNKQVVNTAPAKSAAVKRLLATNECNGCDLSNANLENANLAGASLEGANLTQANLKNANLQQAKLNSTYMLGANLEGANLTQAELEGANLTLAALNKSILSNANLQEVNFQKANLANANLSHANLNGTNFTSANLKEANLKGSSLNDTVVVFEGIYSDGCVYQKQYNYFTKRWENKCEHFERGFSFYPNFLGANLEDANLSDTDLDKVSFKNANLTNINFSNSNLDENQLEEVKLCGVILADGSRGDRDCR